MDGKCGICGDVYDVEVCDNEVGGIYVIGVIGWNYICG